MLAFTSPFITGALGSRGRTDHRDAGVIFGNLPDPQHLRALATELLSPQSWRC
jgi:hypothetical protein